MNFFYFYISPNSRRGSFCPSKEKELLPVIKEQSRRETAGGAAAEETENISFLVSGVVFT